MSAFILTISFLLHVILLFAVYFLFKQIQTLKQVQTKEITDLFDQYLQEIKQENIRLETKITKTSTLNNPSKVVETKSRPLKLKEETLKENEYIAQANKINDHYEPTLEARVLQLYNQGYLEEEIAQKLDCGKTEAALIIKFSKQNRS